MTRLIDADKLKEDLQKHHDFFIDAWKENGVDKTEIPIPDKSRMDEIINCISMVVNAPTIARTERPFVMINEAVVYITQGHIDAMIEYERKEQVKEIVERFMKSLEDIQKWEGEMMADLEPKEEEES